MRLIVILLLILLLILHQDFWWWSNSFLVLGFIPIGLAYHVALSLAAGFVWFLAVKYLWPKHLDVSTDDDSPLNGQR